MSIGRSVSRRGDTFTVKLPTDGNGYVDRQCPVQSCLGFFKVKPGTGIVEPGRDLCTCPYCGHKGSNETFYSFTQIEFAKASALFAARDEISNSLENMARRFQSGAVTMTYKRGASRPPTYRHTRLEFFIKCDSCTCEYALSSESGLCPDCGKKNGGKQ